MDSDGGNFVNVLSYLDSEYGFLDDFTGYVREFIHKLDRVEILKIDNLMTLQLTIDGKNFSLSEMSDAP
ncbi:hypothetical protein [Paenibacillus xylaniclasticus]|uniref:hypothetical protein n=1 Tax=Paenibacillus xylaniclasticus TaxID=588083 RepID=UPI000FDB7B30|nr:MULTISPECIES: hypothetical protein [Paenibacillus]